MIVHAWQALSTAIRMAWDIIKGYFKMRGCSKSMVTVFGGHKVAQDSKAGKDAYQFGARVVQCRYAVVTGGGSGVMKAAGKGAFEHKLHPSHAVSYNIFVQGIDEGNRNQCGDVQVETATFFARKFLLIKFSSVFVFFPGGFGTADEFFELMVLMQTQKIDPVPVILYGSNFWQPSIDWFDKTMAHQGLIDKNYKNMFVVVDTVDELMQQVQLACGCEC